MVTFDGRGSGPRDAPTGAAAYAKGEYAADTVAVPDAVAVNQAAVLVGLSYGLAGAGGRREPERTLIPGRSLLGTTDGGAKGQQD